MVESLLGESGDLIQTGSPCILCTPLPNHWRSNKSLPSAFKVFTFQVRGSLLSYYYVIMSPLCPGGAGRDPGLREVRQ